MLSYVIIFHIIRLAGWYYIDIGFRSLLLLLRDILIIIFSPCHYYWLFDYWLLFIFDIIISFSPLLMFSSLIFFFHFLLFSIFSFDIFHFHFLYFHIFFLSFAANAVARQRRALHAVRYACPAPPQYALRGAHASAMRARHGARVLFMRAL